MPSLSAQVSRESECPEMSHVFTEMGGGGGLWKNEPAALVPAHLLPHTPASLCVCVGSITHFMGS